MGEREVLDEGLLDLSVGLVGDSWSRRPGPRGAPLPDPERQLTLINPRFSHLIGGDDTGEALAGDQLHVDFDLSEQNVPGLVHESVWARPSSRSLRPPTRAAKNSPVASGSLRFNS